MEIVPLSPPQCTCLSLEEDSSAVALFFKLLLTLNPFQHEHYLCIFFSCVFSVKYWMYWQKAASFAMLLQYKSKYRLYIELKIAPRPSPLNGYWYERCLMAWNVIRHWLDHWVSSRKSSNLIQCEMFFFFFWKKTLFWNGICFVTYIILLSSIKGVSVGMLFSIAIIIYS